jgi:hypothetical protein
MQCQSSIPNFSIFKKENPFLVNCFIEYAGLYMAIGQKSLVVDF